MKPGLDKCLEDEYKSKVQIKDSKCMIDFVNPSSNLSIIFKTDKKDIYVEGKMNNQIEILYDATGPIKLSLF